MYLNAEKAETPTEEIESKAEKKEADENSKDNQEDEDNKEEKEKEEKGEKSADEAKKDYLSFRLTAPKWKAAKDRITQFLKKKNITLDEYTRSDSTYSPPRSSFPSPSNLKTKEERELPVLPPAFRIPYVIGSRLPRKWPEWHLPN